MDLELTVEDLEMIIACLQFYYAQDMVEPQEEDHFDALEAKMCKAHRDLNPVEQ